MILYSNRTIRQDPTNSDVSGVQGVDTRRRRGATLMEYLFMLSLILVVVIIGVGSLGQETKKLNEKTGSAISKATNRSSSP